MLYRIAFGSLALALIGTGAAQLLLNQMPRYDRYEKLRREIANSVARGEVAPRWAQDGKQVGYAWQGKNYIVDLRTGQRVEGEIPVSGRASGPPGDRRRRPERGRQYTEVFSTDGKLKAFYRDRNVWLSDVDGKNERGVTTEGSEAKRTKFGQASWVYGEELNVLEAMWFSPDGKYLAYYGFDESKVKDYYLTLDHAKIQTALDVEAYPKAGTDNPVVGLYIHDLAAKKTVKVDTDFGDSTIGHYVYEIRWAPAGKELLFNRTNRKQNVMQFCAAEPVGGKCRIVVEERQPQSWTDNAPVIRWLKDQRSFLWQSDRSGYYNIYLGNLDGRPLEPLTKHAFEVAAFNRIDEEVGKIWYHARSGENPYLLQLHSMNMDGTGDRRLTDPKFNNSPILFSPDARYFTVVEERVNIPPKTTLRDATGKLIAVLAESDLTKFDSLGLKKSERFVCKAADGVTDIYGSLNFPSDFDPNEKYPLIVSVYAGPESGSSSERFDLPDAVTEFGFLVATIDGRGTQSRGKAFLDAVYGKLGVVEIDDQAAGVKYLATRPYVDGNRVGIHGTSYGGYASVMALVRHPEVFQVGVASSSVTDWRHYDTIYTERYMGLPWDTENKAGYDAGSAMTYATNLKGRLMLFYGSADNNVHPSNTLQFTQALQRAGKRYDMLVGTDMGHAGIPNNRLWEYFIEHLILPQPRVDPLLSAFKDLRARRFAPG